MVSDRDRYSAALIRQHRAALEADFVAGRIRPVPYRITQALDLHGLYGPEVDVACGGEEPMVDEWEAGTRVPTLDQLHKLAALTRFPIDFFFSPAPAQEISGVGFVCRRSGPKKDRCQPFRFGPDPDEPGPAAVQALPLFDLPPAGPGTSHPTHQPPQEPT